MTQDKADLLNQLVKIENEIQELWEYHPENPDAIDVITRFNDLQKDASTLQNYLQTLWTPEEK